MKVHLAHYNAVVECEGPLQVAELLAALRISPVAVRAAPVRRAPATQTEGIQPINRMTASAKRLTNHTNMNIMRRVLLAGDKGIGTTQISKAIGKTHAMMSHRGWLKAYGYNMNDVYTINNSAHTYTMTPKGKQVLRKFSDAGIGGKMRGITRES